MEHVKHSMIESGMKEIPSHSFRLLITLYVRPDPRKKEIIMKMNNEYLTIKFTADFRRSVKFPKGENIPFGLLQAFSESN